jgi:integrase/recombinase XerD
VKKIAAKKFTWVSLYQVGGHWRCTTCRIAGRRITRRLGRRQSLAERFAAQASGWIEQWKARLLTEQKLLALLGESLPVDGLLRQYESHLKGRGRDRDYVQTIVPRIRIVLERGSITRADGITHDAVTCALESLKAGGRDGREGRLLSEQTLQHYARAIRQFVAYLMRPPHKLYDVDPLHGLEACRVEKIARPRRAPTPMELAILLTHVRTKGNATFGLSGEDRAMLYAFAIATGLRAGELREIRVGWVDLEQGVVAVPGDCTKNGEPAHQPLPQWLISRARPWLLGRGPNEKLWRKMPTQPAIALRADQVTARSEWIGAALSSEERRRRMRSEVLLYRTDAGYFDFHALRHAYVTRVVSSGATVKTAQSLARHSDPKLTIGLYSHVEAAGLRSQVDAAIPDPHAVDAVDAKWAQAHL